MKTKVIKFLKICFVVLCCLIIFMALMNVFSLLFASQKQDLTSQHKYGISEEGEKIAKGLTTPINITLYVSKNLGEEYPELGVHEEYLLRLLEGYKNLSKGKITYNIKNPEPFSITQAEAKNKKIRSFKDTNNQYDMYYGAVFSNAEGRQATIPYFSVQRQNYTEYDILRNIAKLDKRINQRLGLVSFGGSLADSQIFKKISADYKIEEITPNTDFIPLNIKALLVYNPQSPSNSFLYALDQYIMRGGNLILLIDPYPQHIINKYPYVKNNKISLDGLLNKFGIKFNPDIVVTQYKPQNQFEKTDILSLKISKSEAELPEFVAPIQKMSFLSAGELVQEPHQGYKAYPIFFLNQHAGTLPVQDIRLKGADVSENFSADDKKHVIGYYLEGYFESSYKDKQENQKADFLIGNIENSKILILADTDFVSDDAWNLTTYAKDSTVYDQIPTNNNADFLLSMIDYMNNNQDLAKIGVSYLMGNEKNITEQLAENVYNKYLSEFLQKTQQAMDIKQKISRQMQDIISGNESSSLAKIQEIDAENRELAVLANEIKALNYKLQKETGNLVSNMILYIFIFAPICLLGLCFIIFKIYEKIRLHKIERTINE